LRTETVRVLDEYAFSGRSVREVLKQLDPTNIRIFSTMAKVGPRNLLEVSRLTGIPFTTVHHRVAAVESKVTELARLHPNVAKLGLVRLVVLVAAKAGLEDLVTQALRIPEGGREGRGYWRVVERCEGAFTHHSIQIIPVQFLQHFREYISTMRAMNLIKSFRIVRTDDSRQIFPDFSSYSSGSGEWVFEWDGWLQAAKSAAPAETIKDSKPEVVGFKRVDLEIIANLEVNGSKSFMELAERMKVSPSIVKYHYDKLRACGVAGAFDFQVWPYPAEVSSFHEVMLDFTDKESMNRFFSVSKKLFFLQQVAKVLGRNSLIVRSRIVNSQVENLFGFFSELVNAGQLVSYSSVRINMGSRLAQTVSPELFDDVSGWQWDVYRNLLELNKL